VNQTASGAAPDAVEKEGVFGRLPVRLGEREYSMAGAHGTCFAYAIATWCFLVGSYAADLVGAVEGTVCLIAGNLIGAFLTVMPTALACQRHGLEQMDYCKTAFGQQGAKVILLFYLINMLGWSGLLLVMFGNGVFNTFAAFGFEFGRWMVAAGAALGLLLAYLITVHGVHRLAAVNNAVTPILALVILYMLYMLFANHGWAEIAAAKPLDPTPNPAVNYAIVLELGIANGFSWWGGIGFIARNTRTRRGSVYPQVIQLGLSAGIVASIALYSALIVGSDDPTRWMVPLGGLALGSLALMTIGIANVSAVSLSLFASGLTLRHIPALRRYPWWQVVVITVIPCSMFIVWPQQLYDRGSAFLAFNGTMYAPICGVLFADFFLLRRQRVCLRSIFDNASAGAYHYWKGFNPLALGGVLLGQATYFFLYNPFTGSTHPWFVYVPASIASFVIPAAVYYAGMRLYGVRLASDHRDGRLLKPNI